jgi:hypothetical protein
VPCCSGKRTLRPVGSGARVPVCVCLSVAVAMLDLKASVAHLLTRVSSPFHCRQATGGSRHHPNKVHPELTGCKPRRLFRIALGHRFSSVKSGGSSFRYEKVSYVECLWSLQLLLVLRESNALKGAGALHTGLLFYN